MGTPSKVCIRCNQDCSGKPRTKDLQGNYTCKACLEQPQANAKAPRPKAAAAAPVAAAAYDDDASFMASLLDSDPAPADASTHASTEACPSCGSGMALNTVICMTCGYNKQTGAAAMPAAYAAAKPKRGASALGGAGALAAGAAGAVGSGAAVLVGSLLCAAIAGAIGAGIWAAIVYNTGYEIGWIAWGVGILVGVGALAGSRGHAGLATGGIAVIVAVVALLGGKYLTVDMFVSDAAKEVARDHQVSDENAIAVIARAIAAEHEAAGRALDWPYDFPPQYADMEDEFPPAIWSDAASRWANLAPGSRTDYRIAAEQHQQRVFSEMVAYAKNEGFIESFTLFDLLFFGLAIASAAGIGSGASAGNDDD